MITALRPGLAHERDLDLLVEQEGDQPAQDDEHHHPETGRCAATII